MLKVFKQVRIFPFCNKYSLYISNIILIILHSYELCIVLYKVRKLLHLAFATLSYPPIGFGDSNNKGAITTCDMLSYDVSQTSISLCMCSRTICNHVTTMQSAYIDFMHTKLLNAPLDLFPVVGIRLYLHRYLATTISYDKER